MSGEHRGPASVSMNKPRRRKPPEGKESYVSRTARTDGWILQFEDVFHLNNRYLDADRSIVIWHA